MKIFNGKDSHGKVLMVQMTPDEAIQTIRSLAEQLAHKSPNMNRYEKFAECGTDFSIAVMPQKG